MVTRVSRCFVDLDIVVGRNIHVPGQTLHYLKNVLRLREGDIVILFNGKGGEYRARIARLERDRATLEVHEHDAVERESTLVTELGLSIIKREAMDTALRKATELGVTRIVPLLTDFTTVPHKQAGKRFDHWQEITRSACEQCGRNRLPALGKVTSLKDWLDVANGELKLITDPKADTSLDDIAGAAATVSLLSGPEGGFSEVELTLAAEAGFQTVSLGPRILRADTAALATLALIQHKWGDL